MSAQEEDDVQKSLKAHHSPAGLYLIAIRPYLESFKNTLKG